KDIEPIMKKLKENNIYTIARIVSFKDPNYAKSNPDKAIIKKETGKPFTNSDGIIWVSPHDRNLWAYNIAVAEQAAKVGFNEVQFDYVRFPASNGGKLDKFLDYRNVANESKPETIQKYLKYARKKLSPLGVYISADTYGQIGTFPDDMGLGQYWEAMSSVVDYMCPMQYPSHYGQGAYGIKVPDANPYKTIYYSTRDSINRNENIDHPGIVRPWIQAFTATWVKGHINYGPKQIQEQVKAMKDLGVNEYLLWSPSNNYKL
ncbi:MAG: putative glycoside hydrolase, partial [Cetobacterium sp.]|nr:putative glycoside hydrolase [Cetobacterium sp.]